MIYESMCSDELNPMEYEAWYDHIKLKCDEPDYTDDNIDCPKCGDSITKFELHINNGVCPGCDSKLITVDDIPF